MQLYQHAPTVSCVSFGRGTLVESEYIYTKGFIDFYRERQKNVILKLLSLYLRPGQMVHLPDINHVLFIGSPRLGSLNEMEEKHFFLSDIPLYDVTRELVLLNQQRIAELDVR